VADSCPLPASAFTTNTSNNLDVLLSAIRTTNSRNPSFSSRTGSPVISAEGGKQDQSILADCVFGPGIPSRKELMGGVGDPYINLVGDSPITVRNIYIRGASVITSGGMGVTSELPSADKVHYGSTAVTAPWTWRQSYHTFIGSRSGAVSIERLGGVFAVLTVASDSQSRSYYQDLTGKLLPNHIQLLTTDGVAPGNNSSGPFFDQFIHAHSSLRVNVTWSGSLAGRSTGPSLQGFVGKMGANGHNAVKTRAALLGNGVQLGQERGFDVFLSGSVQGGQTPGYTVVQRAGETFNNQRSARPEMFGSGSFGEPSPLGYNPVITDADGGKATVGLNFGVRSWRTGISPEYAGRISNNTVT
jgi:hypothetical protein